MTFSWNVPGSTAEPAVVVRDSAPPGDVARAALHLLDTVLDAACEALGDDGPEQGDLRLELDGDELVLGVQDVGDTGPHEMRRVVEAALPKLRELGIDRVIWPHYDVAELETAERKPVDGVDNPL